MKEILEKAKKALLTSANIEKVYIDTRSKKLEIIPPANKEFYSAEEVFEGFSIVDNAIIINGTEYKITNFSHFNTTVYNVVLKMKKEEM